MQDARFARVAALYRAGSSTDSLPVKRDLAPAQAPDRARLWQAELAKSMARIERRAAQSMTIVPAAAPAPLHPTPGMLIVGSR
jgi:hypothetical protein